MKKYNIIVIAICIALLGAGTCTAFALEGSPLSSLKDSSLSSPEIELTELQLQKLEALKKEGAKMVGAFVYQEKVITGEADPAMQRMTLQEVRNMVAQSDCFEDVLSSLESRQTFPDFIGGSGVSIREYWLDATGNEKIVIILEQAQVFYDRTEGESSFIETLWDN